MKVRFAHLVNVARFAYSSDLAHAQPITLQSMVHAQAYAAAFYPEIKVQLLASATSEDQELIPSEFKATRPLERSVLDVAHLPGITKRLPLLVDLFEGYQESEAEYCIYTNIDILLQPYFYVAVADWLAQGYDALIINRRRVPTEGFQRLTLPRIWSQLGASHPGFDCFVFRRELLPEFKLGKMPIGLHYTGIVPAYNLFAFAHKPLLLEDQHLTLHLGLEVMTPRDKVLYPFGKSEFERIHRELRPRYQLGKFPHADKPFLQRYRAWALNPSFFVGQMLKLEWREWRRGLQRGKDRLI